MNRDHFKLLSPLVSSTYLTQGVSSRNSVSSRITELISQRRIPEVGWSADEIEILIREISLWDSNNFAGKAAVGEREGRCFSEIVRRRHWGLVHGIGRSGDVNAEQPKAAGSSLVLKLTTFLVRDALKSVFHITNVPKEIVVLPVATGMALMLGMTAVSQIHRDSNRKNVIWSRIDQKSCIKAMTFDHSLTVHVVEQKPEMEGLASDVEGISLLVDVLGADTIHSIVLTTSTFAPRTPDDIPTVSRLCKQLNIPLIVNNAYGLQCSKCCHLVNEALKIGRVDLVVQSTDKNFAVPVGGSILFGPLAETINRIYPGRASISPILDLFITLLEVGKTKWREVLQKRKELFAYLIVELNKIKEVRVLKTPKNQISVAVQISGCDEKLGSELFLRNVSGSRVFVASNKAKQIDQNISPLMNFGCHSSKPLVEQYINVACAIGATRDELDIFITRFRKQIEKRARSVVSGTYWTHVFFTCNLKAHRDARLLADGALLPT